jgi:hypothetical protein
VFTRANRPKAVELHWHRLRANVACLIDWRRIAAKNAGLGPPVRHQGTWTKKGTGRKAAMSVAKTRARLGLYSPYGPSAKKDRPQRGDAALAPAARRTTGRVASTLASRTGRSGDRPSGRLHPFRRHRGRSARLAGLETPAAPPIGGDPWPRLSPRRPFENSRENCPDGETQTRTGDTTIFSRGARRPTRRANRSEKL